MRHNGRACHILFGARAAYMCLRSPSTIFTLITGLLDQDLLFFCHQKPGNVICKLYYTLITYNYIYKAISRIRCDGWMKLTNLTGELISEIYDVKNLLFENYNDIVLLFIFYQH